MMSEVARNVASLNAVQGAVTPGPTVQTIGAQQWQSCESLANASPQ